MKIVVVYIYAPIAGPKYEAYMDRFLRSYHEFPAGIEHEALVVLNGTRQSSELTCMFSSLPRVCFLEHDNSGYDIGGFQAAARLRSADLMVFFGSSTFFRRAGWLIRMAQAYQKHGNALYGAMGNRGDIDVKVWPHIRTTAFWMRPELFNQYPKIITRPEERHPFEHGQQCLTTWITAQGLNAYVVTWTQELLWRAWDSDPNGFQQGDQSSLLAYDHICEAPYYPIKK